MKKFLFALLLCLPTMASAKEKIDDSKYLKGAVPEVNGVVTFQKSVSVAGKDSKMIQQDVLKFVQDSIVATSIQGLRTRIVSDGAADGNIVARVEEYMIFKKQALNLDRTRFRYQLTAKITNGNVDLEISQISYYYNEDMQGENGTTFKAEEWISDAEALNKAGTKLYPRSSKFRRKTVDRANAILQKIADAAK